MKTICNLCLHFARQGGQDRKKTERKPHQPFHQNNKNQKKKIWNEQNIRGLVIIGHNFGHSGHGECSGMCISLGESVKSKSFLFLKFRAGETNWMTSM